MRIFILFLCVIAYSFAEGQFRESRWNMSPDEVQKVEALSDSLILVDKFKNGRKNIGIKSKLAIGDTEDNVYSNYFFVNEKLKSGSYVFMSLGLERIAEIVANVSNEYGEFEIYFGNSKFERLYPGEPGRELRHYLGTGQSVKAVWKRKGTTVVVFRIVNTRSDIFGTWGWLSYYEQNFFRQTVQPEITRGLNRSISSGQ